MGKGRGGGNKEPLKDSELPSAYENMISAKEKKNADKWRCYLFNFLMSQMNRNDCKVDAPTFLQ